MDHRADIYSLGVVFYEMLTGELPLGKFEPPSRKVQVDVRLDDVVLRALEKEPERRYQHASQVKTAVDTIAGSAAPPPASASRSARRGYSGARLHAGHWQLHAARVEIIAQQFLAVRGNHRAAHGADRIRRIDHGPNH